MRTVDKLDKIGPEKVKAILTGDLTVTPSDADEILKFIAISGGNDVMAAGAMKAALRLGLRVPEDLAVTGLDDSSACGRLEPELTSVHIDCRRMGELSVARLQALLAGETDVPQVTVVPTELRVRGSS